jgi:adenylate cyclase
MSFRIGITIGDVVERDGDLLGDGVNIAARLEGLAEVGGICVSRAVHEQVANKLSVQFADIGEQEVKNIPTPVHAYMVAMRREDGTYATPQLKKPQAKPTLAAAPNWTWPLAVTVISVVAIGVGGFLYFTKLELPAGSSAPPPVANVTAAAPATKVAAATPATSASPAAVPANPASPAVAATPPSPLSLSPASSGDRLTPESVPFIGERARRELASEYAGVGGYKAFALNINGINSFVTGQPNEEAARTAAIEQCQRRAEAIQSPRRCELYAVGDIVVYPHGRPPMPSQPWVRRDASTERPFSVKDVPMVREPGKVRLENVYVPGRKPRSIALGPGGQFFFNFNMDSPEESQRRNLESCGALAGVPCMIVAVDDVFVVPVPASIRPTGFFSAANNGSIAAEARDDVARQLAEASFGWSAVAVGAAGRPGLGLKAASEQNAVSDALGNCARRDSDCHVIAIGPFAVGSNQPQ